MTSPAITVPGRVPVWTLPDRLRKAREDAGLEQTELAADVGISRRSVINYERGTTEPRRPVLVSWAMRTGVDLEWLTTGCARLGSNQRPTVYKVARSWNVAA